MKEIKSKLNKVEIKSSKLNVEVSDPRVIFFTEDDYIEVFWDNYTNTLKVRSSLNKLIVFPEVSNVIRVGVEDY